MQNQIVLPEIAPAEFSGQKVLSTIQIDVLFKCKRNNITDNFRNHKAEFVEGVDYFHIMGDELKKFKHKDKSAQTNPLAFANHATNIYVWTQSGVEKLSNFIGTDAAKLVYTSLKFGYFENTAQSQSENYAFKKSFAA